MQRTSILVAIVFALAGMSATAKEGAGKFGGGGAGGASSRPAMGYLEEPASAFVPGAYYFQKASFYLKNKRTLAAIDMLKVAASLGNKFAQYDLGVIYFNGAGETPVDRPRGVAWFGIAAQTHALQADTSLLQAWKLLGLEERKQASAITDQLLPEYADPITARRAKAEFVADRNKVTGSRLGHPSHLTVTQVGSGDGLDSEGVLFIAEQKKRMEQMLKGEIGTVEVGGVQTSGQPAPARNDGDTP